MHDLPCCDTAGHLIRALKAYEVSNFQKYRFVIAAAKSI